MGEIGEDYLVGLDKLMRSDSCLDPTDHRCARKRAQQKNRKRRKEVTMGRTLVMS